MDQAQHHLAGLSEISTINMKHGISKSMIKRFLNVEYLPTNLPKTPSFDWIQNASGLPWLNLLIDVPVQLIAHEIQNIQHLMVPHRDDYSEHQGWESFCIHGQAYNLTRESMHYEPDKTYHWTNEAIEFMPGTVAYFQNQWPSAQYHRIRVMRLKPGGYISIHSDYSVPKLNPINVAITQPDHCNFVMEKYGCVPYQPGLAFWLDVSNRHTVFNNSNQDRWHLIVHQDFDNIDFQDLVAKSYKAMYNQYND